MRECRESTGLTVISSLEGPLGAIWENEKVNGNFAIRKLWKTRWASSASPSLFTPAFVTISVSLSLSLSPPFFLSHSLVLSSSSVYYFRLFTIFDYSHFWVLVFLSDRFTQIPLHEKSKTQKSLSLLSLSLSGTHLEFWLETSFLKWVSAMAAPKPEEISHPPMDQLQGLEYCIDSNPSWGMFNPKPIFVSWSV